jgi:hypothetical protein
VSAGILQNLRVHTSTGFFLGTTVSVFLNVNGSGLGFGCNISGFGNSCEDTFTTFPVAAGDLVSLTVEQTGISNPTIVTYSLELAPPGP